MVEMKEWNTCLQPYSLQMSNLWLINMLMQAWWNYMENKKGSASYQDYKESSVTPPQNILTHYQLNQQHPNTSSTQSENWH